MGPDSTPARTKSCEERYLAFISDISDVSYNIRLTKTGQLATLLYSRLAHKEAAGNSAYFLEYKPHLTNIYSKLLVLQKNRCMRKELKSLSFQSTKTLSKHFKTILSTSLPYFEMRSIKCLLVLLYRARVNVYQNVKGNFGLIIKANKGT